MAKKTSEESKKLTYRIPPEGSWANAWKLAALIGALGTVASLFGMTSDVHRFAFSWLFAFMTFLAIGLGGLFMTIMLHLTGASWGVTARRSFEMLAVGLPTFAVLFIPIAMNTDELYPWASHHHGDASHEEGHEEGGEHGEADEEHGSLLDLGPSTVRAQEARDQHDLRPSEWEHEEGDHGAEAEGHHDPEHAIHAETIEAKLGYLNTTFFYIRAVVYFAAWIFLSLIFFLWSTRQDKEKGLGLTKKMQGLAPGATFIFGLTLTFAAFDWMMSAEPSWYSTIFGVQYFAVSAVNGLATMILIGLGLRRAGIMGDALSVEHFHDIGKLLFGFIVFWAYISLSQFLLIWYAGIPEEATYYHLRWTGGGGFYNVSVLLMVGHFVIPFLMLLSRNAKRNLPVLGFACAWLLVFHVVELYWLVMPYALQTGLVATQLQVHWLDLAALMGVGGIYFAVVLFTMTRYPLIPVGDPRLARSLTFTQ